MLDNIYAYMTDVYKVETQRNSSENNVGVYVSSHHMRCDLEIGFTNLSPRSTHLLVFDIFSVDEYYLTLTHLTYV